MFVPPGENTYCIIWSHSPVLHNVLWGETTVFEAEAFTVALGFGSRDGQGMNTNSSVVWLNCPDLCWVRIWLHCSNAFTFFSFSPVPLGEISGFQHIAHSNAIALCGGGGDFHSKVAVGWIQLVIHYVMLWTEGQKVSPTVRGRLYLKVWFSVGADALKVISKTVCAKASWHSKHEADETGNKHQPSRINSFSEVRGTD